MSHVTKMTYVSVLIRDSTKPLIIFVIFVRHEYSARRTTSFIFTYGFSLCGALLIFRETSPNSKMSFTFVARVTKFGERARRAGQTIAARLVTDGCNFTLSKCVAHLTDVLFWHSTRYVCGHIMSFDIVVE